jgi:hypothetical protein
MLQWVYAAKLACGWVAGSETRQRMHVSITSSFTHAVQLLHALAPLPFTYAVPLHFYTTGSAAFARTRPVAFYICCAAIARTCPVTFSDMLYRSCTQLHSMCSQQLVHTVLAVWREPALERRTQQFALQTVCSWSERVMKRADMVELSVTSAQECRVEISIQLCSSEISLVGQYSGCRSIGGL